MSLYILKGLHYCLISLISTRRVVTKKSSKCGVANVITVVIIVIKNSSRLKRPYISQVSMLVQWQVDNQSCTGIGSILNSEDLSTSGLAIYSIQKWSKIDYDNKLEFSHLYWYCCSGFRYLTDNVFRKRMRPMLS